MIVRSQWGDDNGLIFWSEKTFDCDGVLVSSTNLDADGNVVVPVPPFTQCGPGGGGGVVPDVVTTLVDNGDGTWTYTNEIGATTTLALDVNVGSLTYDPLTGEIILTETDGTVHTIDIGPTVVPTLCEEMAALPLNTPTPFDRFTDEFVVRNSITGVCKRVNIPTMQLSAVGWQTTRTVGGLQSAQNMVQTPSAYQNFPSTHLQGNFTVPFGGTTGNSNVRLDFNFNLQPSATGATFPAGAWADRYVIDLRVRLDGLAIAHVIRTLASVGEMGNGVPAAFTAYPEYENIHLSVLLGTAVTAGPHTFAVQYSVFTNTVTTGHTRTVQIGWSDWMVESNYV